MPEPEPAPLSAPEVESPRGWFGWRRGDAIEPVIDTRARRAGTGRFRAGDT